MSDYPDYARRVETAFPVVVGEAVTTTGTVTKAATLVAGQTAALTVLSVATNPGSFDLRWFDDAALTTLLDSFSFHIEAGLTARWVVPHRGPWLVRRYNGTGGAPGTAFTTSIFSAAHPQPLALTTNPLTDLVNVDTVSVAGGGVSEFNFSRPYFGPAFVTVSAGATTYNVALKGKSADNVTDRTIALYSNANPLQTTDNVLIPPLRMRVRITNFDGVARNFTVVVTPLYA